MIESAREEEDLTEQKYLTETLKEISNPYFLCFGIGICQVLDTFTDLSLGAQRLWQFPGTLALSIEKLKSSLEVEFQFLDSQLKYATIGIPSTHIDNLLKGIYCQQLTLEIKRAAANKLNLYSLNDLDDVEHEDMTKIETEDIKEQSFGFQSLEIEEKIKIEKILTSLCKNIKSSIDWRISITPLISSAVVTFHETDWFNIDIEEAEKEAENKINLLLSQLKEINLTTNDVFKGYLSFLRYKQLHSKNIPSLEVLYQNFFEWSKNEDDCVIQPFISLFELINIKSFSEAYCESVGSLMNLLVKKGRNLSAAHFSRELIFTFNAPPVHVLSESVIPDIVQNLIEKEKKYFFRKLDTSLRKDKLKFKELSSSLGNFRESSNTNSHLPVTFFK